jgi:hypothetical protein
MTNDWRYSDERMQLRQDTFLKLKNHFNMNEIKLLYEFCHLWVSQGNTSTKNVETEYQKFVKLNER